MFVYTIKLGDTLGNLASEFGVNFDELLNANGILADAVLPIGASLIIPSRYSRHVVEKGDSLYSIALKHDTSVENLLSLNPKLKPPYTIYPNDYIIVPEVALKPSINTNGYCYPNISDETLDKTLPYLTYISIFSYNLLPDGNLKGIDDERIIRRALEQNVAPFMVVTNIGEKVVTHSPRKYGKTKFGISRFFNGYLDLLTLWFLSVFGRKPMHFFGILGSLMFFIGFIAIIIVGASKIYAMRHGLGYRLVTDSPYFFLSITAMILGTQLFLAGFLGEIISRNSPDRNKYNIEKEI